MRNIFLEKLYLKWSGEASSRPFHKKSKLTISVDQQTEMLVVNVSNSRSTKNIKINMMTACFYFKVLFKNRCL